MRTRPFHFIEIMDLEGVPKSLRHTLVDILEYANSYFRPYNHWVASQVLRAVQAGKIRRVVELGAGSAPITRRLARDPRSLGCELVACDIHPNRPLFEELRRRWPDRVHPIFESVDYSKKRDWGGDTLLVLNATFHHVPPEKRKAVLAGLAASSQRILIFEPLKRELASLLSILGGWVPGVLAPLVFWRKGWARRVFWCWLVPVAPFLFMFDGFVSCLRMWSRAEWEAAIREVEKDRTLQYRDTLLTQQIEF